MTAHARRLLVLVQVRAQCERFAAATTDVRLVGRVRLNVSSQVGLVCECLAAVRTPERLLARVSADVSLQKPRPREALAALRTLAALAVSAHVHAVRRSRRVHLVAVRTLSRRHCRVVGARTSTTLLLLWLIMMMLTGAGRAVTLPVSGQVAGGAVRPSTLGTMVQRRRHVDGRADWSGRRRLRHSRHEAAVHRRLSVGRRR